MLPIPLIEVETGLARMYGGGFTPPECLTGGVGHRQYIELHVLIMGQGDDLIHPIVGQVGGVDDRKTRIALLLLLLPLIGRGPPCMPHGFVGVTHRHAALSHHQQRLCVLQQGVDLLLEGAEGLRIHGEHFFMVIRPQVVYQTILLNDLRFRSFAQPVNFIGEVIPALLCVGEPLQKVVLSVPFVQIVTVSSLFP